MVESGLGFGADEEGSRKMKRGRFRSRWGSRRRGSARGGGAEETTFYSSGHSSGDNEAMLFASAPGSFGGRCSFESDLAALSPSPRSSLTHLLEYESSFVQGLKPEPVTIGCSPTTNVNFSSTKSNALSASTEQVQGTVQDCEKQEERNVNLPILTSPHNMREDCCNQRITFEAFSSPSEQHRRWRPGSLDLNAPGHSVAASPPHTFLSGTTYMKSTSPSSSHSRSTMFPRSRTNNYWHSGFRVANYHKGWSSERVPLPAMGNRRYGRNAPLFSLNNGRAIPSKWEDAERWICSPVSGDGSSRPFMLPYYYRRPKSKSGPLGDSGLTSGLNPCFHNGRIVNITGHSPFLAGVLATDLQFCGSSVGGSDDHEGYEVGENLCFANSEGYVHGSAGMLMELSTSFPCSEGTGLDNRRKAIAIKSPKILRKHAGTQMSPEGSTHSSPPHQSPLCVHTITDLQSHFPCLEIRDVQVDDRVTVTRWSRKQISRCSDRRSTDIIEWDRKTVESTEKHMSKEEAKITAWENLQKAKAEAALQKLEMKLQKKRSSSMDKILKRLKSSQRKAQHMRNSSMVDRRAHLVPTTGQRFSYLDKYGHMCHLRSCFTCHAL